MRGAESAQWIWLRLGLCLTASVGLHAGLTAVKWSNSPVVPADHRSLAITLVEAPTVLVTPARKSVQPAELRTRPAAPSNPVQPLPVQQQPGTAVIFCPSSDAAIIDEPAASSEAAGEPAAVANMPGGEGGPAALAAAKPADGGQGGGMIKAIPRYESNPLPHYPRLARQNRWEGTVRLRAMVTAGGEVEGLTLERSSGHAALDRSALEGVRRWRFIPAARAGVPVACEVSIPVAFRLNK